jgi:PAS domain S-box-containing protein
MTVRDKLEIGLKEDAPYRKDNLPDAQVRGLEIPPRAMEYDRLLEKSESRYRRLFEAARDGILILNAETGKIEDANPFMSELLGYAHDQLVGKELWEIGVFEDIEKSQVAFHQLQQNGVIRYENLPLKTTKGVRREVEFVSNIYQEDGRDVIQCNIRDITDRKRLERQLEEQAKNIGEANRLKSDFLAILSHELRNPVAAIRYALPQLEKAPLDQSARTALAVVSRQLTQLVRLVDDLLDVARITTGKIALKRERVTLDVVINAAVESVSPVINAGRHAFEIVMPDEPLSMEVDSGRVSQVVINLLTNAAKYTPSGGKITLDVSRAIDQAVIRVRDNGMGIAEDQLPRLFEMFAQMNPPEQSQGGLGIGLTIAKRLVQLHGGSIEAHSGGPGRGSEFVVRLPLALTPMATQTEQRQLSSLVAGMRLKVLMVDDNIDLVEMLKLAVEGMGHEVRTALDGQSAISTALSYRPDVVLLDLGLPIVSGLNVARELRRHREIADMRLVALTGWGQEVDRRQTSEAGFDNHLTKPTAPEELERLLAQFAAERA